jgi:glucose-1-phosphate adenylyltransferase
MVPIGGKFRIVDFSIRNSQAAGIDHTIIYSQFHDGLEEYVGRYASAEEDKAGIDVKIQEKQDLGFCHDMVRATEASIFIVYNGDNPSIIDFTKILAKFKKKRSQAMLFQLQSEKGGGMGNRLLVVRRKKLLSAISKARDRGTDAPNVFEMIINHMVNEGIGKSVFTTLYWPIKTIVEYYRLNREIVWNTRIFGLLYNERIIQSKIESTGYATIGRDARIVRSFMSDYCHINGTVENSIIYPGVVVEEDALVRDSILLPFVRVGQGSRVLRTIVDEPGRVVGAEEDQEAMETLETIGRGVRVGSQELTIKSSDFPRSLNESLTLLGSDALIPANVTIGGGCYVAPGMGEDYFRKRNSLGDGESILP